MTNGLIQYITVEESTSIQCVQNANIETIVHVVYHGKVYFPTTRMHLAEIQPVTALLSTKGIGMGCGWGCRD